MTIAPARYHRAKDQEARSMALIATPTGIPIIKPNPTRKEGIIAATKESLFKAVPPPVKVRSKVGAGDCTIAGLALKLAYGEPMIEACRLGAAMGAAAVLTPGTGLCHRADVERLLPEVGLWEMSTRQRARTYFTAPHEILVAFSAGRVAINLSPGRIDISYIKTRVDDIDAHLRGAH